jgi:hypothetical protein
MSYILSSNETLNIREDKLNTALYVSFYGWHSQLIIGYHVMETDEDLLQFVVFYFLLCAILII